MPIFFVAVGYTGKNRPNPTLQADVICREGLADRRMSFRITVGYMGIPFWMWWDIRAKIALIPPYKPM